MATNIDEMDEEPGPGGRVIDSYGGVSLHRQSHGRSFLSLVEHRFGGQGLYLLDEPEAALSPARLMTLLVHIRHLVGQDSQFLIATHSPILMAYPGACIYQLSEAGITQVDYRDTEHYWLTRRFLEAPEQMMELLFRGRNDYVPQRCQETRSGILVDIAALVLLPGRPVFTAGPAGCAIRCP